MKKISALMAMAFICAAAFSHSLESICGELSKNRISAGTFVQEKYIGKNGRTLKSSGEFIFCDEGIMWKTLKPFPSTLVLGADYMIQISKSGQKTVTDTSSNETFKSIASTLSAVFSNDVNKLRSGFNVEFKMDGDEKWSAVLFPKDKTVALVIENIILCGARNSAMAEILSISLNESGGDRITYSFTDRHYPKELSSDEKSIFKAE